MPNKLKDIFTKEPLERKTRFEFFTRPKVFLKQDTN